MADNFNWDIVVRLATQGARQAKGEIEGFSTAVDEMVRTGKVSEKAAEASSRAMARQGKAASETTNSTRTLERAQGELNKALQDQNTERAAKGLDSVQAAQLRLTRATENRQRAEQRLATSAGGQDRVAATDALTEAVKRETSAQIGLERATASSTASIISQRYANYDLATSMFTLAAGVTAAGVGVTAAFASQESAFTSVERTAEGSIDGIRQKLIELSTQIPLSFNELAGIATLGNQLGIGADQIEDFTQTVAQFSIVTGISAEESALAFGKLGNLLGVSAADYDRLASSIALVGRTTAATEAQIVSVASEIAPAAAAAGFTADQVIGLSGALSSLKVPPERSRSTILQFFETLNMAVAEGGDKLSNFAAVVGVSASELEAMVRSGQGEDILTRFIGNVSTSDTIEITQALEALGLAGLRTNPTIRALAGNMDLLQSSISTGAQGWDENTELQRQMAMVLDDLNTKWVTFVNAAMNAAAAIGSSVGPALGVMLDALKNILIGLTEFANSDIGKMFFQLVGTIGLIVAAYATLRGGIALATASLQAFSIIATALGGGGILAGLRGLASAFGLIQGASTAAATGVHALPAAFSSTSASASNASRGVLLLRGALLALGKATVVLALLQGATSLIFDFGGSMEWLAGIVVGVANFLGGAFQGLGNFIADFVDTISTVVPGLEGVANKIRQIANMAPSMSADILGASDFQNWAKSLTAAEGGLTGFSDAANDAKWEEWAGGGSDFSGALDDAGSSAAGAAKEVRTLVDYGNDLQSVFSRAFDIRFSGGSTLDAITSTFISIREATEESARNIQKLKAEIQGLQSDLSIQKYFLGIAIEYGDSARAEAIQANIAKIQADLADKTANLTDEQDKNSKELTGNSKAALANRKQMEDLVTQYQAHITALASSGLGQAELARRTAELRAQFVQQATQMGYSRSEVERYAASFDDMRIAIDRVPRNITVTADVNPAIQALNELEAKARSVSGAMGGIGGAAGAGAKEAADKLQYRVNYSIAAMQASVAALQAAFAGNPWEAIGYRASVLAYQAQMNHWRSMGGFSEGGYTGSGGKHEPAGIVHRGEYVVPKNQVNQRTGLPYADAMGRLQRGASGPGYAGGGFVRGGSSTPLTGQMALSAMGVQQFQQIMAAAMKVYLDGQTISGSTAQQFAHQTAVGAS